MYSILHRLWYANSTIALFYHRTEEMAEFYELPGQPNPEQTESTSTSHQAPHYTSLVNPGTSRHDYTELITGMMPSNESTTSNQQHPLYSNVIPQDNQNTMPHQVQQYTALIHQTEATTHSYAELIRPETSSRKSTSDNEQHSKVYSSVMRQDDGKKVTVKFAISDPSGEIHQIENQALVDSNSDLVEESIASHSANRNMTAATDRDSQKSATCMYSTVVRQGGEKVTIRILAPTEEQDPW